MAKPSSAIGARQRSNPPAAIGARASPSTAPTPAPVPLATRVAMEQELQRSMMLEPNSKAPAVTQVETPAAAARDPAPKRRTSPGPAPKTPQRNVRARPAPAADGVPPAPAAPAKQRPTPPAADDGPDLRPLGAGWREHLQNSPWGPRYWHRSLNQWVYLSPDGSREHLWINSLRGWIQQLVARRGEDGRWQSDPNLPDWWANR